MLNALACRILNQINEFKLMTIENVPTVSVVMSVYNGKEYLELAIKSILAQSFKDFEFIIINDGSTDDTGIILNHFSKRDERIRVISRENKGLVYSLNEGVNYATSPLIARMDADDICFPDRLEKQVKFMKENPEVVCAGSYYEVIDEDGDALTMLNAPISNEKIQEYLIKGHTVICHPTAMYRKETFLKVGGYDSNYFLVEDLDLWLKMGEVGLLANLPVPLVQYRTNNKSVSTQSGQEQLNRAERVIAAASARRGIPLNFQLTAHWRPDTTKNSIYSFKLKYGWWAFHYKNKKAAFKYALQAIRLMPWRKEGWKLYLNSMLKLRNVK